MVAKLLRSNLGYLKDNGCVRKNGRNGISDEWKSKRITLMKEKLQSMEEYPFQVLHTTGLYMFKMKHYHYHTCLADAVAKCESILFGEKGSTLEAIDRQTGEILWRHPKEHPKHQVWINQ